ncbi:SRPBCC family protein [Roseiarcus fermentans]|uniref:SRPBCC family protein n=1 Tax=Roseiarcus fermentans TaxID=1473586 RepID=UPI000DE8E356
MPSDAQTPNRRIVWPRQHSPSSAVVFAHNTVDIRASPQRVWSLLIDCVAWPRWYKHCSDVSILRGGAALQAGANFASRR